jgi:hypothetical protein
MGAIFEVMRIDLEGIVKIIQVLFQLMLLVLFK